MFKCCKIIFFCWGLTLSINLLAQEIKPSQEYTDAQLVKILNVANDLEITVGRIAINNAASVDVVSFAKLMVDSHLSNKSKSSELVSSEKLEPKGSPMTAKLKAIKRETQMQLKNLKNIFFDKAYIKSQISRHQDLLTELELKMIPSASNMKLKLLLESTKVEVKAYLAKAKEIQSEIGD